MPIYEYKCSHCTNKEEKVKKIDDRDELQVCTKCRKGFMQRIVSQTAGFTIEPSKIYI